MSRIGLRRQHNSRPFEFFRAFFLMLGVLLAVVASSAASAKTITFETLACTNVATVIPNGYEGLNWSNFYCVNGSPSSTGYANGRVSGSNVAFNGFGDPASFTITAPGATRFNLISMNLTGAWRNNLNVRIQTFKGGVPVTDTNSVVQRTGPTLVTVNASDIDRVTLTASGGVNVVGDAGDGTHVVLDDLIITDVAAVAPNPANVPALSSWMLLVLCTLLAGVAYRSRMLLQFARGS